MIHDDEVRPLLNAKEKIEAAITGYLDKVAALRKRQAALQSAIEVLRSDDDALLNEAPSPVRVVNFDQSAVERAVVAMMDHQMTLREISTKLTKLGLTHSKAGLKRILATSPEVDRSGERDQTRYFRKGVRV